LMILKHGLGKNKRKRSFFLVGLLFYDVFFMIKTKYSHGIGNVLGSLLILWVLMEIIETQINHLKVSPKGCCFNVAHFGFKQSQNCT
jgi:hypothetical protein